jgi:hypothetical protein
MQYLQGQKEKGTIEDFEVVLLEPHGGELEGFVLIRGEKESLARLRSSSEFIKVIVGVQLVHNKVGVIGAYTGAEMGQLLQIWQEQESGLL